MIRCHGCEGKGWVDSKHIGPTTCPICKGTGQVINEASSSNTSTNVGKRKSPKRWAFCEAINRDGTNLVRYKDSVACWRAEIGDPTTTGYTGWGNKDATDSFRHKGWGVIFGDPEDKEKGMRVTRLCPIRKGLKTHRSVLI